MKKSDLLLLAHNRFLSVLALLLCLLSTNADAAFDYPVGSVNSFALGGCYNLSQAAPLDLANQPSLTPEKKLSWELSISRLYNLSDLDQGSGMMALRLGDVTIAAGIAQLSFSSVYWERQYTLASSYRLFSPLRIGIGVNYQRVEFTGGYSSLDLASLTAGGVWKVNSNLHVAIAARNLNQPKFDKRLSSIAREGDLLLAYKFSDQFSFFLKQSIFEDLPDRVCLGQQVNLHRDFSLFFGVGTEPTELSGGVTFQVKGFGFDYGFRDNVYLGGTHKIGLRYSR